MKYYSTGIDIAKFRHDRTGQYNTLEEALRGLLETAKNYELAYLCISSTKETLAYMYHGMTKPKTVEIEFHMDRLKDI